MNLPEQILLTDDVFLTVCSAQASEMLRKSD